MREDFEIYKFLRNGHQWYGFKVDYFGIYSAPSEKQILAIRKQVQKQVAKKLEWIEKENQKYYARLAEEEKERASLLHEAKQIENNVLSILSSPPNKLSNIEKKLQIKIIYGLVQDGLTNKEIQEETGASLQTIARIRHWNMRK